MEKSISTENFEKVTKMKATTDLIDDVGQGVLIALMIRLWTGTLREEEIADTEVDGIATMMSEAAAEMVGKGDISEEELAIFLTLKDETDILKDKLRKLMHEMDGG